MTVRHLGPERNPGFPCACPGALHNEVGNLQGSLSMYAIRVTYQFKRGHKTDYGNWLEQIQPLGLHLDLEIFGLLGDASSNPIIILGQLISKTICLPF